jgi:DNA invertase Pin-like site-specific DNA recombinase
MDQKFVTYYRVSTDKQGRSGLGLEAQKKTVLDFINGNDSEIVGEYVEVESGKNDDRPELQKAIRTCKLKKARLVVSKLDRLSRDLHFITELQRSGVQFTIAEMPEATELTVHIYAAMAQHERKEIGRRTKNALAAAKARGVALGNPCILSGERIPGSGDTTNANQVRKSKANEFALDIAQTIKEEIVPGQSLREIADDLNNMGYRTARDKEWQATSVKRIIDRTKFESKYMRG